VQYDQFFLQSTPILDDHGRIIPVSDHQARVASRLPVQQYKATLPPGSSGVRLLLTSWVSFEITHNCRLRRPKKTTRPTEWCPINPVCCCCYHRSNIKHRTLTSILNTAFSLLPPNSGCFWSVSQKVPQSHLKISCHLKCQTDQSQVREPNGEKVGTNHRSATSSGAYHHAWYSLLEDCCWKRCGTF